MKLDNSPVRGSRDLLPDAVSVRDHVSGTIAAVYHGFGYRRIETPALESIERLSGGQGGDNEKLIYQVLRRGLAADLDSGTHLRDLVDLGLRFDLTVPLSRYYGQHHSSLPLPFRSFQFGPVWRAERPQKGRYRQFHQCDIDIIGEPGVLAEAELIEATTCALAAVGLGGTTVRLSDRRVLTAVAASAGVPEDANAGFFVTLDKLDKIGWSGVRAELIDRGLSAGAVTRVVDVVDGLADLDPDKIIGRLGDVLPSLEDSVLRDLDSTVSCLGHVEGGYRWAFDPTLVRGMGYYTGQIFEVSHPDMAGSLAGGGRYDRLIGRSLGRDVPACGFSIGFERIVDLMSRSAEDQGLAVLCETDVSVPAAMTLARRLRADGRSVSVVRRSGKIGAQLGRLESWGYTAFVHVLSDEDIALGGPEERALGAPSTKPEQVSRAH